MTTLQVLTVATVLDIFERSRRGESPQQIARALTCSVSTIRNILNGGTRP